jgi:hypothetical protein
MWYNLKTNEEIYGSAPEEFFINVCCLINNSFIIFSQACSARYFHYVDILELKIKNNKNMYMKILKDSINMNNANFRTKYKHILDNATKNINEEFIIFNLSGLLKNFNIEFYNIEFYNITLSHYRYTSSNFVDKNYMECEYNNKKQSITNVFSKEQIITTKYYITKSHIEDIFIAEYVLNIHNLK